MIADLDGELGEEINYALTKATEADEEGSVTPISIEAVVEELKNYTNGDPEVFNIVEGLQYILQNSALVVPTILQRNARTILRRKQTAASSSPSSSSPSPSSAAAGQSPAPSFTPKTSASAIQIYHDHISPEAKTKELPEFEPVEGSVYVWMDTKEYFMGQMDRRGCFGPDDLANTANAKIQAYAKWIAQQYRMKTTCKGSTEPIVRGINETKRTITKALTARRRKHLAGLDCQAQNVASSSTYESALHRLNDRRNQQQRKAERAQKKQTTRMDPLNAKRMVPLCRTNDASNGSAPVQRIGTEVMVVSARCRVVKNTGGYVLEHVQSKKVFSDKKTFATMVYPHSVLLMRDLLAENNDLGEAPASQSIAVQFAEANEEHMALLGMQNSANGPLGNERAQDQANVRGSLAAAKKTKRKFVTEMGQWGSNGTSSSSSSSSSSASSSSTSSSSTSTSSTSTSSSEAWVSNLPKSRSGAFTLDCKDRGVRIAPDQLHRVEVKNGSMWLNAYEVGGVADGDIVRVNDGIPSDTNQIIGLKYWSSDVSGHDVGGDDAYAKALDESRAMDLSGGSSGGGSGGGSSSTSSSSTLAPLLNTDGDRLLSEDDSEDEELEDQFRRMRKSAMKKSKAKKRRNSVVCEDEDEGEEEAEELEHFDGDAAASTTPKLQQKQKKQKGGEKWQPAAGDNIEVYFQESEGRYFTGAVVRANFGRKTFRSQVRGAATGQKTLTIHAGATHVAFSDGLDFSFALLLENYDLEPGSGDGSETIWRWPTANKKHAETLGLCTAEE
jgi:hypothetical protein